MDKSQRPQERDRHLDREAAILGRHLNRLEAAGLRDEKAEQRLAEIRAKLATS